MIRNTLFKSIIRYVRLLNEAIQCPMKNMHTSLGEIEVTEHHPCKIIVELVLTLIQI